MSFFKAVFVGLLIGFCMMVAFCCGMGVNGLPTSKVVQSSERSTGKVIAPNPDDE